MTGGGLSMSGAFDADTDWDGNFARVQINILRLPVWFRGGASWSPPRAAQAPTAPIPTLIRNTPRARA